MGLIYSFLIAWSMYSNVPVPQVEWTDKRMKYAMCFFPLIGSFMGAAAAGAYWLAERWGAGRIFLTMLLTAMPFIITGGIHMDGYMDTCDARHSFGDRAKKLEILKDPHIGAFSVICLTAYMAVYIGAISEFSFREVLLLPVIYTAERAMSAITVVNMPKAKKDGLVSTFARTASDKAVTIVSVLYLVLAAAAALVLDVRKAVGIIIVAAATAIWYCRMTKKEFGGVTGDLSGYFLQVLERNLILAAVFF